MLLLPFLTVTEVTNPPFHALVVVVQLRPLPFEGTDVEVVAVVVGREVVVVLVDPPVVEGWVVTEQLPVEVASPLPEPAVLWTTDGTQLAWSRP